MNTFKRFWVLNFKNQNEDSDNKRNIHFDGNNQLGTILEEKTKIKIETLFKNEMQELGYL